MSYQILYTKTQQPIIINKKQKFDINSIQLFGKNVDEWGLEFNNNLLHILENFACPSSNENLLMPDNSASNSILSSPIIGQKWYSTTTKRIHTWTGVEWSPLNSYKSISGNSGLIFSGEYIPIPTDINGTPYELEDCAIIVAPVFIDAEINSYICNVSINGLVTCVYVENGGEEQLPAYASYVIICNGSCRQE